MKNNIPKNAIIFFILLASILGLAGCGNTVNLVNATIENTVIIEIPIHISTVRGDGVYFVTNAEIFSSKDYLTVTRISLDDGDMQTTIVPYDLRLANVQAFYVTEYGDFKFFIRMSGEYALLLYDPVADVMNYTVITDALFFGAERRLVRHAEFTRDGNLFVAAWQGDMEKGDDALLFDQDGNLLGEIDLDNYFISDMAQAADDQLFLRGWPAGIEDYEIYEEGDVFFFGISRGIDPQTGALTDTVLMENFQPRDGSWISRLYSAAPGGAFDLYFDLVVDDVQILHGITLETGTIRPLLNWAELDIPPPHREQSVYFFSDGRIATFQHNETWRELVIISLIT